MTSKNQNLHIWTPFLPLKDIVCVLDQNQSGLDRQVMAQNGVLKIVGFGTPSGTKTECGTPHVKTNFRDAGDISFVFKNAPLTPWLTRWLTGERNTYALCSMGEAADQQWLAKRCRFLSAYRPYPKCNPSVTFVPS